MTANINGIETPPDKPLSAALRLMTGMRQLYLDELEARLRCHKWGCSGACRIALPSDVETEGFQGGLA